MDNYRLNAENVRKLLGPLSEALKDGIVLLDDNKRIVFANSKWIKMHKIDPGKVVGADYRNFLAKQNDKHLFDKLLARVGSEESSICESEHLQVSAGGSFAVETTATTFQYEQGEKRVILFERDISARKTAEKLQNATYRIASAASFTNTLPELFEHIHKIVEELIAARNFYIALYDQKTGLLDFPYFVDEFDEAPNPGPLGRNLTSYVIKTGRPLLVDPDNFAELVRKGEVETVGSPSIDWLGVPLIVNRIPLGVIVVQSYTAGLRYGKKEVDLLTFVSGQIAMAIERRKTSDALKEGEARLRILAETTSAGTLIFEGDSTKYINPSGLKMLGYKDSEAYQKKFWEFLRQDYQTWVKERAAARVRGEDVPSNYEVVALTKEDREIWLQLNVALIQFEGKTSTLVTAFDITGIVQAQENLKYLAHHDFLTGLENRWAFHENLLKAMEEAGEKNRNVALLFLDLDRFKELNDTEGHILGDKILRAAASRLASTIEDNAGLGRIGSDEFTVILKNAGAEDAEAMAKKILLAFEEPFSFSSKEFHISLSIGICIFPEDGEDLEALLKNADIAMFRAKAEGGAAYQFYRMEMSEEAKERIDLRNRLHGAIDRNELALYFQPIVEKSEGIVGLEALLRWIDPKYGMVSPEKFIPIAEESGLIVPLGEWVLNVACSNLKNLHADGFPHLKMAVNLSARQFHRRDLLDVLERVLERVDLKPQYLELEITERTAVMDLDSTTAMLYALSRRGIRLAIDDFGAGYSSMTYLKRFPIHCLKIDMSFIRDMERDPKDLAIIKAIITMAHGLGLEVVAEGVETEGQYRLLKDAECDHFQGHYFGKALPLEGIELLKKNNRAH